MHPIPELLIIPENSFKKKLAIGIAIFIIVAIITVLSAVIGYKQYQKKRKQVIRKNLMSNKAIADI